MTTLPDFFYEYMTTLPENNKFNTEDYFAIGIDKYGKSNSYKKDC